MLASDVQSLVALGGLGELSRALAISRREAEQLHIRARRALLAGGNPVLSSDQAGTLRPVRASSAAQEPADETTGATDQGDELEQTAQARARRINHESAGLRDHSIAQLRGRIRTLERNVEKGFPEWSYDLRLSKRILELVEGVTA